MSKQKGVGFDAYAMGARQVRYKVGGNTSFTSGDFNPAAQAFVSEGGGEHLQGAGPINPAGYSARYGGASPGVQWQGASAELLMAVGTVLDQAFAAGRLGSPADWTGNATWQECLDYAACWPSGTGPFADYEVHRHAGSGSSPGDPIPVDDAGRVYGAVWQLPPPDGRWAMNVHGGHEKPVLVIPPIPPTTPKDPPKLPPVPKGVMKDLADLGKLSGNVTFGQGLHAAVARVRRFVESVGAIAGVEE